MTKNGPQGVSKEDVTNLQSQIITADCVAGDAAGARMLGIDPSFVEYIPLAYQMGIGNIKRIKM